MYYNLVILIHDRVLYAIWQKNACVCWIAISNINYKISFSVVFKVNQNPLFEFKELYVF